MKRKRFKTRTTRKLIGCKDSDGKPCRIALSVRGREAALHVSGGNEFAHLSFTKLSRLLDAIYEAMDLLMERTPPEEVDSGTTLPESDPHP